MYTHMYTCNFQRPPVEGGSIISIAFIFVRQRLLVEGGSTIISIAFMFSPIYLRLEDNVTPPPEIEIGLNNAIEKKSFQVRSASAFYNLPPSLPSFQYLILFYAWTGNLWISISNGYLKIWISGFQITVILELDNVPPPPPHPHCQKMKGLFLDYIQLLMIGQAIRVMKVNQNAKKAP